MYRLRSSLLVSPWGQGTKPAALGAVGQHISLPSRSQGACSKPASGNSGAPAVHRAPLQIPKGSSSGEDAFRIVAPCFPLLLQLPCCSSGTCQLLRPRSPHSSRACVTWALAHSAEGSCWVFPHSPGALGPLTQCLSWNPLLGSPKLFCTSFPINTGPGSEPPPQPLGGSGQVAGAGRLCLWKQKPQPSSRSLSEPQTPVCLCILLWQNIDNILIISRYMVYLH